MKKNFVILFPVLLLLLPACNDHAHHHGSGPAVQLDNGKRWQANLETTAGIAQMQAILENYEGRTEVSDRQALKEELETAFQDIFRKCTMKGEAHDQLHNYLLPMKELFEKIGGADAGESQKAAGQLKVHLEEYSTYFE
jgi:hypothetical protein